MKFSEWLYQELIEDGTIEEESVSASDLNMDFLIQETDLEESDIEDLRNEYEGYCDIEGIEPEFDF